MAPKLSQRCRTPARAAVSKDRLWGCRLGPSSHTVAWRHCPHFKLYFRIKLGLSHPENEFLDEVPSDLLQAARDCRGVQPAMTVTAEVFSPPGGEQTTGWGRLRAQDGMLGLAESLLLQLHVSEYLSRLKCPCRVVELFTYAHLTHLAL